MAEGNRRFDICTKTIELGCYGFNRRGIKPMGRDRDGRLCSIEATLMQKVINTLDEMPANLGKFLNEVDEWMEAVKDKPVLSEYKLGVDARVDGQQIKYNPYAVGLWRPINLETTQTFLWVVNSLGYRKWQMVTK